MNINRDIGKVLLQLNNLYYEKGMKKISVSIKGIRNEKIPHLSRKVIVSQLIKSKEFDKFFEQFIGNLKDELDNLIKNENVKAIIEKPYKNEKIENLNVCDKQLVYLYLAFLNKKEYAQILQVLLKEIVPDDLNMMDEDTNISAEKEILEYRKKCKLYEEKIEELTIIAKQRKEKINELEVKLNIIIDGNEKTKNENNKLLMENRDLKTQIQNLNNGYCIQKNKIAKEKTTVAIISKDKIAIKNQKAVQLTQDEFFLKIEKEKKDFEQICVYKKGIHISKLRKIMRLSGNKALFFDSTQELLRFVMEDGNENRSN